MQSMTGFGGASQEFDSCRVSARFRTVNHRYLDLVIRMPEEQRHLESSVRKQIADGLSRGRVELRIEIEDRRDRPVEVHLNHSWIEALQQVAEELAAKDIALAEPGLTDLLRFPDALRITSRPDAESEEIAGAVESTVGLALSGLQESRAEEGAKLQAALTELLDTLESLVRDMENAQGDVRLELEKRLRSRLEELVAQSPELGEMRIEQELAILVERSDVREELDRLSSHLEQFRTSMLSAAAVGKKLDFLAQEILRELTTLGAKCRQAGVVQMHIDAKLLCEQIREQVQNVE